MKKFKLLGILLIAVIMLPILANAEKKLDIKSGILYGGTLDDVLSDVDFFSNGSYVVVGNTKSSYRSITNLDEPKNMGIIAIYDKDNTLIHEYNYDSIAYSVSPGGTTLSQVLVLDDSNFIVCGSHSLGAFCAKVTTAGERVWNTPLASSSQGVGLELEKTHMELIKTSDNHILVISNTLNNEVYKMDLDGNIVYTIDSLNVNSFIETDDYYILGGNASNKAAFYLVNKDTGNIANTVNTEIPSVGVIDIDKVGNGYVIVNKPSLSGKTKLIKLTSDFQMEKEYEVALTYNMEVMVLSDGNILTIETRPSTPTSSYITVYNSTLDLVAQQEHKYNQEFGIYDFAVSPVNNNFYFVGQTSASLNVQENMGGTDGIIMSYALVDLTPAPATPVDGVSEEQPTSTEDDIKNPNTGMFISLVVSSGLLVAMIVSIVVVKSKNKLYKI